MSLITRIANAFRPDRLIRDLDEEMQSHLDEAAEHGRDPAEARRAFGSVLRQREASREFKLITWLDALRSDVVFGFRQLLKHKIPSAAAVLSLALAIGACVSAFRLVDALLLRPLPVASPERLFVLTYQVRDFTGKPDIGDSFEYPHFRRLREAVKDQAELMAIANATRIDLTHGSDQEMEKAYCQYVSGRTFKAFGLKPLLGRLLTSNDDVTPGAHPRAVLSYDYWQRRFGRDPTAVGRFFRLGNDSVEIVGVLERGFTGTETGTLTDVFVPIMMNKAAIEDLGWSWLRTWVQVRPGHSADVVRQTLQAATRAFREEKAKTFTGGQSNRTIEQYVNAPVFLEPASAGVSGLQKEYRQPLAILGVLVALVLLIACANVANLMSAQAAARAREMALRVSIGAGRWRLVQLVLVESVLVALLASALWWPLRLVGGSVRDGCDQFARQSRAARTAGRLARDGLCCPARSRGCGPIRPDACLASRRGEARQRSQRGRRSACAAALDECAGRRAGRFLFSRPLHGRAFCSYIRPPLAPANGLCLRAIADP